MCDSLIMSLRRDEFKRKYLTKYPADTMEKLWTKTEELVPKLLDGEVFTDWSIVVDDKEIFVFRGEGRWYMLRPATKNVWLATGDDKNHLTKIIEIPRWEAAELLEVFTWMLDQPARRMKQIK